MQQYGGSSNTFMNEIFGPLPKQYCLYFYLLSIIGFSIFVFIVLYFLYVMLIGGKKLDPSFYVMATSMSISYLLIYFTYRLLYSMCANSLH